LLSERRNAKTFTSGMLVVFRHKVPTGCDTFAVCMQSNDGAGQILHGVPFEAPMSYVDDTFIFFNQMILLNETEIFLQDCNLFHTQLLSGVLMYNTGLAMHHAGLQQGNSQRLLEALKVYFVANWILHDLKQSLRDDVGAFNLALLALINNIAHIHAHFCRMEITSQWTDRLSNLLLQTIKPRQSHKYFMLNGEYRTFFPNVSFFGKNGFASPMA